LECHEGKKFTNWRLPTRYELSLLFLQKVAGTVGGFELGNYWSFSDGLTLANAYIRSFFDGAENSTPKSNTNYVRAIRSF
jgi:hypothetical protein